MGRTCGRTPGGFRKTQCQAGERPEAIQLPELFGMLGRFYGRGWYNLGWRGNCEEDKGSAEVIYKPMLVPPFDVTLYNVPRLSSVLDNLDTSTNDALEMQKAITMENSHTSIRSK